MRKYLYLVVFAACLVMMSSCGFFGGSDNTPVYTDADLIGTWEAPSQLGYAKEGDRIVFVFQDSTCIHYGETYGKWGYTFDEGDNNSEEEQLTNYYHGNGWFGWKIVGKDIQTYQTQELGAVSPYKYVVSKFEGNTMELSENGHTYTLTKVK